MLAAKSFRLSGNLYDNSYFRFYESNHINLDKIYDVLNGKLLGTISHDAISIETCRAVCSNFWNNQTIRERKDGVPAITLGAYHYKKDLDDYFNQVDLSKPYIDKLFLGINNFVEELIENLTHYFARKNITFRLARNNNRDASKFVMRACDAKSKYVISPHDDVAQCRTVKQKGFEIEKIPDYEMIAVNMCLENFNGGELNIWNIQADNETRFSLNIEETGYPYPPYLVEDFDKLVLPIRAGDIYCFNGRNIHAVKSREISDRYRTTITFFMGFIDKNTIIYWT